MIWLKAYEMHLEREKTELNIEKPRNSSEWYRRCRDWLLVAGGRRLWEKDMVWGQNKEDFYELKTFRFQLGLRNYRTPTDHTNSCKLMREIASKYAIFNVTTFHEYYPFADQYLELKPSLVRNFELGLLSMFVVTMVMIPDIRAAFAVVLCIASINVGVLGFMTFWGVNLDSVSMITVIMCIGFAVDLSAHIAYAYSQAYGSAQKRVVFAMETLGWPVFLGASSTILGITVLTLVDSYIVQIFFKTVFLVILFSMIHGLLFLPVFLMFLIPNERKKMDEENSDRKRRATKCGIATILQTRSAFHDVRPTHVNNDSKKKSEQEPKVTESAVKHPMTLDSEEKQLG
uniref:SSD domain-containing protein n=1 Tax=Angiostrongylus cantonensis TaxID=6313 RepID=A0A0K0DAN2_ANGCA